jgi:outer membrane protein OmpA-like peptidoglycan-associated protein
MRSLKIIFIVWILIFFLAGCSSKRDFVAPSHANRDLIVLLPDPDGKVGTIHIATKGGSQILDKPGYVVEVEDIHKLPNVPRPIEEKEMRDVFGPALSAQPDPPSRFISFLLFFENDTTKLTHESKNLMAEILGTIKSRKSNEVFLVGHTDLVGPEGYNNALSSRRANYVRDLLVSSGIKLNTLFVSYYGKARPLVSTKDEVPEPRNRRVEVIVR